ncbi:hypothetical protein A2886_02280 [candidate division WWE3 bacterium RIFCSPHIGHO2_01_FULL_42_13]|uniref:inorganic diphosphatase n=1 Tax=candidate division WWE3 bacterium RIFCSPHIGHO2_01_FULL_42_13 TaxID=1802617 RepID=A0A1F4URJ1_UNCKA|nr:MAG: hypothetical protein A2886_02280 [candidate division WWE3 bacterium RIFCSPHIGHO2_01_FULL_42_13]
MRIFVIGHVSPDLDAIAAAVEYTEFLLELKRYGGSEIIPVRAGEPNIETKTIFKKFNVELPKLLDEFTIGPDDFFVLVDHHEQTQRHEKIVDDKILEIIDHHRVNLNFSTPIRVDVKPVGSTSTVIYDHFYMYNLEASYQTSALALAGILSDTVGLKSSTTTGLDREIAQKISKKINESIEKLTFEIFRAKSDISGLTAREIAKKDFKVFDFGTTKVLINQVETVESKKVLGMKNELVQALDSVKKEVGATLGFIMVTDILAINSWIIYTNEAEKEVVEKAFITHGIDNVADIGPKISRKKDVAPAIEKTLL